MCLLCCSASHSAICNNNTCPRLTWQWSDEVINFLHIPLGGVVGQEALPEQSRVSFRAAFLVWGPARTAVDGDLRRRRRRRSQGSRAGCRQGRRWFLTAGHVWTQAGLLLAGLRGVRWGYRASLGLLWRQGQLLKGARRHVSELSIHTGYLLTRTRSCGFRWCEKEVDNGTMQKSKWHGVGKNTFTRKWREYLLLGLYAGTALRFPSPVTHLLVLFWMEKAHPLCAAHVVPVQEVCELGFNPPQKDTLPKW